MMAGEEDGSQSEEDSWLKYIPENRRLNGIRKMETSLYYDCRNCDEYSFGMDYLYGSCFSTRLCG